MNKLYVSAKNVDKIGHRDKKVKQHEKFGN